MEWKGVGMPSKGDGRGGKRRKREREGRRREEN